MDYKELEKSLSNYKIIKARIGINKLRLEMLELEDPEDGVSAIEYGEPSSKTNKFNSVVENAAMKNIERRERQIKDLEKKISRDTDLIQILDLLLGSLNETEREVIELFYIEDATWDQVSFKTSYSNSWCQELRCKALNRIVAIGNV